MTIDDVIQAKTNLGKVINSLENFNHIAEIDVQLGIPTKVKLFELYRLCQEFSVEFERIVPDE
jgi:hypothetical protein